MADICFTNVTDVYAFKARDGFKIYSTFQTVGLEKKFILALEQCKKTYNLFVNYKNVTRLIMMIQLDASQCFDEDLAYNLISTTAPWACPNAWNGFGAVTDTYKENFVAVFEKELDKLEHEIFMANDTELTDRQRDSIEERIQDINLDRDERRLSRERRLFKNDRAEICHAEHEQTMFDEKRMRETDAEFARENEQFFNAERKFGLEGRKFLLQLLSRDLKKMQENSDEVKIVYPFSSAAATTATAATTTETETDTTSQ
jgi:hypothetical protein